MLLDRWYLTTTSFNKLLQEINKHEDLQEEGKANLIFLSYNAMSMESTEKQNNNINYNNKKLVNMTGFNTGVHLYITTYREIEFL